VNPGSFELSELRIFASSEAKRPMVHLELGLGHLARVRRPGAWRAETRQILEHLKAYLIVKRAKADPPAPPKPDNFIRDYLLKRKPAKRGGTPEKGRAVRVGRFDLSVAAIPPSLKMPTRNKLWRPEREEFDEGEVRVVAVLPKGSFEFSADFSEACRRAGRLLGDVAEALADEPTAD
jgi:hypothetical protein